MSGNGAVNTQSLGLTPNILLVNFNKDFTVRAQQQYTLMFDVWEVYIGRFVNPGQDGLFLYDRTSGEVRVMDFTSKLLVNHYQAIHNLDGNWEVHTGDFNGSGHAQVLLYNPGTGTTQFLVFARDLSLSNQITDSSLGAGLVLYVGHFGMPALSVMMYDPVAGQSTFVAFDSSLQVAKQYTVQSWDQRWQVLLGAFLDRSTCQAANSCGTSDDVLVLNRETGKVEQFTFTFGNQYRVFDSRSQAFLRDGATSPDSPTLSAVDASALSLVATLDTGIKDEELY